MVVVQIRWNERIWELNIKIFPELLPKSQMGKAVAYTFCLYHGLVRYVSDGKFQIDNNPVENVIRPLALGRKNYLLRYRAWSIMLVNLYYKKGTQAWPKDYNARRLPQFLRQPPLSVLVSHCGKDYWTFISSQFCVWLFFHRLL